MISRRCLPGTRPWTSPTRSCRQPLGEFRGDRLGGLCLQRLGFLDQGADPVRLPPFGAGGAHALDHLVAARIAHHRGGDRRAPRWQLVDQRIVEVRVGGHRQRARYRGRRHHQLVRRKAVRQALLAQRQALVHAEAVLLVDDHQPQPRETDLLLEQRVRADGQRCLAQRQCLQRGAALRRRHAPAQQHCAQTQRIQPRRERAVVLFGQQFGGCHDRDLPAVLDHREARERGHQRLAAADVALHQAQHRRAAREVAADLGADAQLRAGRGEGERAQQALAESAVVMHHGGAVRARALAHQQQPEVVRQQFLGREALLVGMGAGQQLGDGRIGRRPVQVAQRLGERSRATQQPGWQQLAQRIATQMSQSLFGK
jgi:hypothetical protein